MNSGALPGSSAVMLTICALPGRRLRRELVGRDLQAVRFSSLTMYSRAFSQARPSPAGAARYSTILLTCSKARSRRKRLAAGTGKKWPTRGETGAFEYSFCGAVRAGEQGRRAKEKQGERSVDARQRRARAAGFRLRASMSA